MACGPDLIWTGISTNSGCGEVVGGGGCGYVVGMSGVMLIRYDDVGDAGYMILGT